MLAGYKARYYLLANSDFPLFKAATEKMWDRPAALARRTSDTLAVAYECLHEEQQDDVEARPEISGPVETGHSIRRQSSGDLKATPQLAFLVSWWSVSDSSEANPLSATRQVCD